MFTQSFPQAKKKGGALKIRKGHLLIFLRVHFLIPKTLLSLKVYDTDLPTFPFLREHYPPEILNKIFLLNEMQIK